MAKGMIGARPLDPMMAYSLPYLSFKLYSSNLLKVGSVPLGGGDGGLCLGGWVSAHFQSLQGQLPFLTGGWLKWVACCVKC